MSMDSVKYNLGDVVYLRVRPEEAGMITGILFRPSSISYYVSWGSTSEIPHYDIELTKERTFSETSG